MEKLFFQISIALVLAGTIMLIWTIRYMKKVAGKISERARKVIWGNSLGYFFMMAGMLLAFFSGDFSYLVLFLIGYAGTAFLLIFFAKEEAEIMQAVFELKPMNSVMRRYGFLSPSFVRKPITIRLFGLFCLVVAIVVTLTIFPYLFSPPLL